MATGGGMWARGLAALGLALALCLAALALWARPAGAQLAQFCVPPGEGAGECAEPGNLGSQRGLALDYEEGLLYVADEDNNRIDVFEEDGEFAFAFGWDVNPAGGSGQLETCTTATGCQRGVSGEGAGQLDEPTGVAVDNGSGPESQPHAVYVVDADNFRVQRFTPAGEFLWAIGEEVNADTGEDLCTAASGDECKAGVQSEAAGGFAAKIGSHFFVGVGPEGVVHVLDNPNPTNSNGAFIQRLQRFDPEGEPAAAPCALIEGGRANGLAIGPEGGGDFWTASTEEAWGVRKYDASCTELFARETEEAEDPVSRAIALDEEENAFVAQEELPLRFITGYDPSGEILARFGYERLNRPVEGLAARGGPETHLFASQREEGIKRLEPPEPGPLVVGEPEAEPRSVWALIGAQVNPEGEQTHFRIDYISKAACEENEEGGGECFEGAVSTGEVLLEDEEGGAAEDFSVYPAETIAGCTEYAEEAPSPCLSPETAYVFRFAVNNPSGENGAEGEFTTGPPLEVSAVYATEAGADVATLNAEVNPLGSPATGRFEYIPQAAYEANVAAERPPFQGAAELPDVSGGEAPLEFGEGEEPLRRAVDAYPLEPGVAYRYRLLASDDFATIAGPERALRTFSPAESEPCPNDSLRLGPAGLLPDCRAYELVSPPERPDGDIRVLPSTELSLPAGLEQSTPGGEKIAYSSYRAFADARSAPHSSQYIARRVAGERWRTHSVNPPLGPPVGDGGLAALDLEHRAFSEDLCRGWTTSFFDYEPPPAGMVAEHSNLYRFTDRLCGAEGFEALAPLGEPPKIKPGELQLQGVSADGATAVFRAKDALAVDDGPEGQPCEEPEPEVLNCVSQAYEAYGAGKLRLACVLPGGAAHTGPCTAGSSPGDGIRRTSLTGALSADGERLYWSDVGGGEGELYLRTGGAHTREVSAEAEAAEGTSGAWFWGAAKDGSRAIFTTGSLSAGAARLYAYEPEAEGEGGASEKIADGALGVMGMSEDTRSVYFASTAALTGAEENSRGEAAKEGEVNLYLHEAGEGGGETRFVARPGEADFTTGGVTIRSAIAREPAFRTSRVTPDGAHAAFLSREPLTGYDTASAASGTPIPQAYLYDAASGELLCASCNPSGARAAGAVEIPPYDNALHAARALSDDGERLFFDTRDRLAARDTNGNFDVYQWEALGAGGCDASDPAFSPPAGGCVDLVSSGQSEGASRFVEASADGSDAFFTTLSALLPQDDHGLLDLYDAREGGGLPVPPAPAPPCEGDACQDQSAPPEPAAPASSAYAPPPAVASPCRKAARAARRLSRRAKALRRRAARARRRSRPRRSRPLARRARRAAAKAKRTSRRAKRCRARQRKAAAPAAGASR